MTTWPGVECRPVLKLPHERAENEGLVVADEAAVYDQSEGEHPPVPWTRRDHYAELPVIGAEPHAPSFLVCCG